MVALLGMFNLLHILNYAGGQGAEMRRSGSPPLKNALLSMLMGQGKPDINLGEIVSMLDRNPEQLMGLFSKLAGPAGPKPPGASETGSGKPPEPAPEPLRKPVVGPR